MVCVRWTGAAGLEITHDGHAWLIDPYHTRAPKWRLLGGPLPPDDAAVFRALDALPAALEAVIGGHTHFDHVLDFPVIARRFNGPMIGSTSLDTVMTLHGFRDRVTVAQDGRPIELPGGARLTLIRSVHGKVAFGRIPFPGEVSADRPPPLRAKDYRHGSVFAAKVEVGGKTIMQIGSADMRDDELRGHECDLLYLCVPGWKHAPDYFRRAFTATRAKIIVPFHYDDFTRPLRPDGSAPSLPFQGLDEFCDRLTAGAPGAAVRRIGVNERLEL